MSTVYIGDRGYDLAALICLAEIHLDEMPGVLEAVAKSLRAQGDTQTANHWGAAAVALELVVASEAPHTPEAP